MEIFLILVLTGIALLVNIVPSAVNTNSAKPKPKPKVADPSNKKRSQKNSDKAVFVTTRIAGVEYTNEDGSLRENNIKGIKPNEALNLVKDPSNKYDKYAIKIMSKHGCVGFLPRHLSKYLQSTSLTYGNGCLEKVKSSAGRYEYYVRLEVGPNYDASGWFASRGLGIDLKVLPDSLLNELKKGLVEYSHLKVYESLSNESLAIISHEIKKSSEARLKQQKADGLEKERKYLVNKLSEVENKVKENAEWFGGAKRGEFPFSNKDIVRRKKEAQDLYFSSKHIKNELGVVEDKLNKKIAGFENNKKRNGYQEAGDLKRILDLIYKSRCECLAKLDFIAKKESERISNSEERRRQQRVSVRRSLYEDTYEYFEEYENQCEDSYSWLEEDMNNHKDFLEDKEVDMGYADDLSWEDRC